jgi:hypothetical protein
VHGEQRGKRIVMSRTSRLKRSDSDSQLLLCVSPADRLKCEEAEYAEQTDEQA